MKYLLAFFLAPGWQAIFGARLSSGSPNPAPTKHLAGFSAKFKFPGLETDYQGRGKEAGAGSSRFTPTRLLLFFSERLLHGTGSPETHQG